MADKKITYSVGFKADQSGLETIRKSLQEISNLGVTQFKLETGKSKEELDKIKAAAEDVQDALTSAFNVNLNTLDLTKFSQEVKRTQGSFSNLAQTMNSAGRTGQAAFSDLLGTILTTKDAIQGTNKLLNSMANTFFNTIKWSISSSVLNAFTGSIQRAWSYTKNLDESLNNIRIVTEKSNDEMELFAKNANKAAKSLGAATTSYTNAALIYYQQGLGEADVQARTQTTIKAANVTGQSAAEVSEQLTAVWNGYKVVAEEAELYVDKLAAVAATTAADLEELSDGMSKVASAANAMGVDIDQLSAQLSTIVSVTRQDASVVGTALKTIFSRMGDLKVDGVDEFGVSLGDVSGQLQQMGIQVLDQQGNLRDMGTVIEEVAAKWGTWTDAQQQAAAVAIAGKRQYNNLIALFENWDMYESALNTSQTSEGTLQKQQDIYMDSIEARLTKLRAASEGLFTNLIDSESTKNLIDVLTWLVEALDTVAKGLGGLGNILQMVGGIATRMFSSQITQGIGQMYTNHQTNKFNNAQAAAAAELGLSLDKNTTTEGQRKAIEIGAERIRLAKLLTEEEKNHYNILIKQTLDQEKQKKLIEETINLKKKEVAALTGTDTSKMSAKELAEQYRAQAQASRDAAITVANGQESKTLADRRAVLDQINSASLTAENSGALGGLNEKYGKALKAIEKGTFKATRHQESFNNYLKEAEALLSKNANELEDNARQSEKLAQETKELNAAEKARNLDLKRMDQAAHFKTLTNQITNLIGNLTMLASAYSMVSNAISIWKDEELSLEEKLTQSIPVILSVVGTVLGIVLPAFATVKTTANNTAKSIEKSFAKITLVLTAVMAIAAAGAAITKGVKEAFFEETAAEKSAKKFEEAKKSAESAKTAVEDLRNEYDTLLSSINKYQEGRNALDQMAEGTEAWNNKVAELNQQVTDLLLKYPQLAEHIDYVNGVATVSQAGWDELKEIQKEKLSLAERGASMAGISQRVAQGNSQRENLLQNIRTNSLKEHGTMSDGSAAALTGGLAAGGAAIGGIIGTVVPVIGNAIGAAGGAIIGAAAGAVVGIVRTVVDEVDAKISREKNEAAAKEIGEVIDSIASIKDENKREEAKNALAAATTKEEIKAIEGLSNISDRAAEAILANKDAIDQNIAATIENTKALDVMAKTYLQGLAVEYGFEGTEANVFADLSKDNVSKEDFDRSEYLKHYVIAGKGETVADENIGNKINTSNDKKYAAIAVNEWIKKAYGIEGTVTANDMDDLTYQKFEDKQFTLSDGRVVTGRQIREAAVDAEIEEEIKKKATVDADTIQSLKNQNKDTRLAYFMNGYIGAEWKGKTLSNLSTLLSEANGVSGVNTSAIRDAIRAEKTAIDNFRSQYGLTAISQNAFDEMTAADRKELQLALTKAEEAQRKEDLLQVLQQYADDPEKFAQVSRQAAGVDFSNKFTAADFFFKHTEEIQTKIRKQELDYFKTINAELEKNHKLMERTIGLERQSLLDRQVALEKESQLQAQNNAAEARQVLDTYLAAHGESGTFLNADGTVNVKAVNDKIATLDEEIDAQEIEYLNNILAYWDKVIETENAAQEAIDKVIDAQIAAYNYQYEMLQHLLDMSQKFKEFYADMDRLGEGWGAFSEESLLERFNEAAEAFAKGSLSNIDIYIDKVTTEVGWLEGKNTFSGTLADRNTQSAYQNNITKKEQELSNINNELTQANSQLNAASQTYTEANSVLQMYSNSKKIEEDWAKVYAMKGATDRARIIQILEPYNKSNDPTELIFDEELAYDPNNVNYESTARYYAGKYMFTPFLEAYINNMSKYYDKLKKVDEYQALYDEQAKVVEQAWYDKEDQKKIVDEYSQRKAALEAEIAAEKAKMEEWIQNNSTMTFAKALGIDTQQFLKDGSIDFSALEVEMVNKNPFMDFETGTINTSKLSSEIESDFDTVMDKLSGLKDALSEMYNIWIDSQKQLMQLYDQEIQKLTSVNSILKSSADLWQLVGNGSEAVNNIYMQMAKNATTSATYAKMQLAVAQKEFNEVKNLGAAANEEMQNTVRENLQKATEAVISTTQAQLDALAQQFSINLKTLLDNAIGGSLEGITEEWELAVANDDRYLDAVNEAYEIDNLNRAFFKSIDENNNVAAKNKLLTKQAEIEEKLRQIKEAQGKLTQADLDRANAEYELTLKQIALEEAQQTANKMKLVRDANGNYTYQYVADEDSIAKAEEELAAAENNLYNMEKDRTKSLVSEYYSTMSEANTKISEAVAAGDKERVMRLKEYYGDLLGGIQAELDTSSEAFERLGGNIANWQIPFENFTNAIQGMDFTTLFGEEGSITTAVDGLFGEEGPIATLQADLEKMLSSEGILGTATIALHETVKDTGELAIKTGELLGVADSVINQLPGLIKITDSLATELKGFTVQYEEWLKQNTELAAGQGKLIKDQTEAIKAQTIATLTLVDKMDESLDGEVDGVAIVAEGYNWNKDSGLWEIFENTTGQQ